MECLYKLCSVFLERLGKSLGQFHLPRAQNGESDGTENGSEILC
jgi:hypothetical protein